MYSIHKNRPSPTQHADFSISCGIIALGMIGSGQVILFLGPLLALNCRSKQRQQVLASRGKLSIISGAKLPTYKMATEAASI